MCPAFIKCDNTTSCRGQLLLSFSCSSPSWVRQGSILNLSFRFLFLHYYSTVVSINNLHSFLHVALCTHLPILPNLTLQSSQFIICCPRFLFSSILHVKHLLSWLTTLHPLTPFVQTTSSCSALIFADHFVLQFFRFCCFHKPVALLLFSVIQQILGHTVMPDLSYFTAIHMCLPSHLCIYSLRISPRKIVMVCKVLCNFLPVHVLRCISSYLFVLANP